MYVLAVVFALVCEGYSVYSSKTFDLQNFGVGMGALYIAFGISKRAENGLEGGISGTSNNNKGGT